MYPSLDAAIFLHLRGIGRVTTLCYRAIPIPVLKDPASAYTSGMRTDGALYIEAGKTGLCPAGAKVRLQLTVDKVPFRPSRN